GEACGPLKPAIPSAMDTHSEYPTEYPGDLGQCKEGTVSQEGSIGREENSGKRKAESGVTSETQLKQNVKIPINKPPLPPGLP
ncbi:hypothetical protein STEG23_015540, partial [Scotinomys teguina]